MIDWVKIIELTLINFKSIFSCMKKGWKKYWVTVLLLLATYMLIRGLYYFNTIAKPTHKNYINREAYKISGTSQVVELMENLVAKGGHGVTVAWITLETPDLNSYTRNITFTFVRSCNFNLNFKTCLVDAKRLNPGFYGADISISEKDGKLIEDDQIVFFDEKNPISFKELEPIIIPIYNEGKGLSMEMISLKHKAPKIYKLLSQSPFPLNSVHISSLAKIRDITILNKRVIHLVLVTQWSKGESSFTEEGLKQMVFLIAKKIKDNILLL